MQTCSLKLLAMLLAAAAWQLTARAGSACELCCALCGKSEAQTKVCRLVCEEKKITVTCWSCETEDFCLQGPNWPTCRNVDVACGELDPEGECANPHPKLFVWSVWKPLTCPKLMTKKKLQKKLVTKKVPSYKWVVEDLCQACESEVEVTPVPKGVLIPPAPAVEDAKIIGFEEVPAVKK